MDVQLSLSKIELSISEAIKEFNFLKAYLLTPRPQPIDKEEIKPNVILSIQKTETNGNMFLSIYSEFIKDKESKSPHIFKPGTLTKAKYIYQNFINFLSLSKKENLHINDIKQGFIDDYYNFIRTDRKAQHNHAVRHVDTISQVVDYAIKREYYNEVNRVKLLKPKRINNSKLEHLTDLQIKHLIDANFLNDIVANIVRDGFLLQCYTGLTYFDVCLLRKKNIVTENFKEWIKIDRNKNGQSCNIPLIPEAKNILDKYADFDYNIHHSLINVGGLMPQFSNTYTNKVLKDIALHCNIPTIIMKTHSGRRTFAMTLLNNGSVSIESVSSMLGHTNTKTTQSFYAKVSTTKINREMEGFNYFNKKES